MATGIGVDPTKNGSGVITSGRSSLDDRKIWGALYSPGIVSGGVVTTSGSALQYSVSEGVAAIKTATGQIVMAPIPATTVPTTANTGTGARTDIVYVKQRFPADGDSNVVVGVAPTLPANALELMKFSVPVNAANTNAATRTGFQSFAIPYGANLGTLYDYTYTTTGPLPQSLVRVGHTTFYVPTDRRLRFTVTALLFAGGASGFSDSTYCEYGFLPNIDGGDFVIFTSPGLHQAWATYSWSEEINVTAGAHTTNLGMLRMVGPGVPRTHYGIDEFGFGRQGIQYRIEDAGVSV